MCGILLPFFLDDLGEVQKHIKLVIKRICTYFDLVNQMWVQAGRLSQKDSLKI
jgi:hypothetical protein